MSKTLELFPKPVAKVTIVGPDVVSFFVPGVPRPGGSKRVFMNRATGRPFITDDCKRNKEWRDSVRSFALEHFAAPWFGPLTLEVDFLMPRPQGHFGSGRNTGQVKPHAPSRADVRRRALCVTVSPWANAQGATAH